VSRRLNRTVLSLVCPETVWVCRVIHAESVADQSRHRVQRLQNCMVRRLLFLFLTLTDRYVVLNGDMATSVGSNRSAQFCQFHVGTCKSVCICFSLCVQRYAMILCLAWKISQEEEEKSTSENGWRWLWVGHITCLRWWWRRPRRSRIEGIFSDLFVLQYVLRLILVMTNDRVTTGCSHLPVSQRNSDNIASEYRHSIPVVHCVPTEVTPNFKLLPVLFF